MTFCETILEKVAIPPGMKRIGMAAFKGCEQLCSLELPDSLEEIGAWAFSETHLTEVSFPQELRKIDTAAFYLCLSLERLEFPHKSRL